MATHELPWTYKIARPTEDANIGWDVIGIMWKHVNFYDDNSTNFLIAPAQLRV